MTKLITTDIKAKSSRSPKKKAFPSGSDLITPGIIEKLPLVFITLAVSLPKEEIKRLGQWFRRNVHPQVLLDIRQDPKIIGGCQIIWQGFEGDFSLRRKFQEQKSAKISN